MSTTTFKALLVTESEPKVFTRAIVQRNLSDLPDNEVLIRVKYAGLNYKDALSAAGNKGVTRKYPHTPGIDASGFVEASSSDKFKVGDKVLVTSYDLGMNTSGAFADYIRVPAAWVIQLPDAFSLKEAMVIGTAGFTAALSLYKMEQMGQTPQMGKIVVTGATGGVGSHAVAILAKAGYEVIAATGKVEVASDYLKTLGASEVVHRSEVNDDSRRPLLRPKWAGAIDTVGGTILATLLKACARRGSVAACGLVQSPKLQTTVFPFILNAVNLLGIDSAETPMALRLKVWEKLANEWKPDNLELMCNDATLEDLNEHIIDAMLAGKHTGRTVVVL